MGQKEILGFCFEKGVLLDREILNLFSSTDTESAKLIIEKVKAYTNQKILTKNIFHENKEQIEKFFSEIPENKKENIRKLKIELGLSIEILRQNTNKKETTLSVSNSIENSVSNPISIGDIEEITPANEINSVITSVKNIGEVNYINTSPENIRENHVNVIEEIEKNHVSVIEEIEEKNKFLIKDSGTGILAEQIPDERKISASVQEQIFQDKNLKKFSQTLQQIESEKQNIKNIDDATEKIENDFRKKEKTQEQTEKIEKEFRKKEKDQEQIQKSEEQNKRNEESVVKIVSMFPQTGRKIEVGDFVNYFRNRFSEMRNFLQERPEMTNLVSINKLSGNKQGISIIGMVSDKRTTKNKNILLDVEDLTGKIRVLVNQGNKEVYEKAEDICLDSVLGFKGSGNREIFFANDVFYPDTFLRERKNSPVEEYALFISDVHIGSKLFLEKNFLKFIDYLNGNLPDSNKEEVEKIKYLFVVGDLVAGVGVYPNQEKHLEIKDIEGQYSRVAELFGKIRSDIKIIIIPGNHDCVRLMEPQPILDERYTWPIYNLKNVILAANPSLFNIGAKKNFSGFDVLAYHGFSYPYYANTIPSLMKNGLNATEKIMSYLLKNKHLAPSYTSVQCSPSEKDPLTIRKTPDIFVSGHIHKMAVTYCNNILLISNSCWEKLTPIQEKFGIKPDFCKVPMFNLKTRQVKILDFYEGEESRE